MVQLEYDPQGLPEITVEVLGVVSSKVQGDLERFKGAGRKSCESD